MVVVVVADAKERRGCQGDDESRDCKKGQDQDK